jgi:DNA-binding NtrC family response regulator
VKSFASVLIAEEDRSVVSQLQAVLQKSCPEWPVLAVNNGEQALAYLRGKARMGALMKAPVTMVFLLSLTIGQVTAFQILDWIKRQRTLRSVMIALLCGVGEMPEIDPTSKYGAYSILNKPILVSQVAALVSAVEMAQPLSGQGHVPGEPQNSEPLSMVTASPLLVPPELSSVSRGPIREVALVGDPPLS